MTDSDDQPDIGTETTASPPGPVGDGVIGTSLGPYRVLAKLGQGGMGVVYRCEDTRLARQVAVKVLPPAVAARADRRARFQREARTAAAINHPNIATVYDVGEDGGRFYLAMELVEGVTLRARLKSGPLVSNEAVRIAREIAVGLSRAHEKGIIHRDLKPENVMLTREGGVKILDFGLAKLREPVSSDSALAKQETETQEGVVMGTPGYMSPEQATGRDADARTDVYALGVTLHEMLMGELPGALGSGKGIVDGRLAGIVAKCLARERDQRWVGAGEVADTLAKWSAEPPQVTRPGVKRRAGMMVAGAISLVAAGLAGALGVHSRASNPAPSASGSATAVASPAAPPALPTYKERRLTELPAGDLVRDAALSPDGKTLAFVVEDRFWVQPVDGGARRPLGVPGGGMGLVSFYPDGARVLATTAEVSHSSSYSAPLDGSAATLLFRDPGDQPTASPDGRFMAHNPGKVVEIEPLAGGPRRHLASCAVGCGMARWSPDSRRVLYYDPPGHLVISSVDGGGARTVYSDPGFDEDYRSYAWSAPDRILIASTEPGGHAAIQELQVDETGPTASTRREIWRSGGGGHLSIASLSVSGNRIAAIVYASQSDVYTASLAPGGRSLKGAPQRLSMSEANDSHPLWMRDGRVIYWSARDQTSALYAQAPGSMDATMVGKGQIEALLRDDQLVYGRWIQEGDASALHTELRVAPPGGAERTIARDIDLDHWSGVRCGGGDPAQCVYGNKTILGGAAGLSLSRFDLSTGKASTPFYRATGPGSNAWTLNFSVSPDGTTVALVMGSELLTFVDIGTGMARAMTTMPHAAELDFAEYTPDGRSLLLTGVFDTNFGHSSLVRVGLDGRGDTLHAASSTTIKQIAVSPDGQRVAWTSDVATNDVWLIEPK